MSERVGIVGHEKAKFTTHGERQARAVIRSLLVDASVMVSGHSPLGGIDVWAEEEASALGVSLDLKIPAVSAWESGNAYGFKARNLDIATSSDIVHVILAASFPAAYTGRRFPYCYHCHKDHIKSGGCWTALKCGRSAWHIVSNEALA